MTVPTDWPLRVNCPPGLTATVTDAPAEAAAPSRSATLRLVATPFAVAPAVLTLRLHGLTVTVCPTASGEPAGNVEAVTRKWHEPNVVVPLAVLPPEAIENAGVVEVLVNATVVVAVVPKEGMPAGNAKDVFATAAVTVGEAGRAASVVATWTGGGGALLPPPPHATSVMAARKVSRTLSVFFTLRTFRLREYGAPHCRAGRVQQTSRYVNKSNMNLLLLF